MPNNILGEMRRGLIINQGPGCILDFRTESGATISVIHPGLEKWEDHAPVKKNDPSVILEPTLSEILEQKLKERYQGAEVHINKFRLPPATTRQEAEESASQVLTGIRFPKYLTCPSCNDLKLESDWDGPEAGDVALWCQNSKCSSEEEKSYVVPSRFLVACPDGHISDFPWASWIDHFGRQSGNCSHVALKLTQSLDSGLGGLKVQCLECKASAGMGNIFTNEVWKEMDLTCKGERPWLGGKVANEECSHAPKTLLKGASNCYFPMTESVISIPPLNQTLFESYDIDFRYYAKMFPLQEALDHIKERARFSTDDNFKEDLDKILKKYNEVYLHYKNPKKEAIEEEYIKITDEAEDFNPHRSDYVNFQKTTLTIPSRLSSYIDSLVRVDRLREVTALTGFKRINQPSDTANSGKGKFGQLSLNPTDWLPAIEVKGEGIFFSLDLDRLTNWESQKELLKRSNKLDLAWKEEWAKATQYANRKKEPPEAQPEISSRFLLIHSLAHAFINQLALDCGYGVASLKERIYVSDSNETNMAGILVYTSSSDAEGTLGSLSEKSDPIIFEDTFIKAIQNQFMCSNDPICVDGITSLTETYNLSACHSCLILPETSCIHFNRFLDRALLFGDKFSISDKPLGFKGFFEDLFD